MIGENTVEPKRPSMRAIPSPFRTEITLTRLSRFLGPLLFPMEMHSSPLFGFILRKPLRALLVLTTATLLSAGAQAQPATSAVPRSTPRYVTAWPKQVPVLAPDPVLGYAKLWEYWVYDKSFAERFKGFDPTKADPELNPGVHAMVFRAYKEKGLNPVPEMFACEYEIYFDSRVQIPLSERDASYTYPPGVSHSFRRLQPLREEDARFLSEARAAGKAPKSWALIFADGKLDGRYAKLAMAYFPDLVPGLSMVTLGKGQFDCKVMGPKHPDSRHWIWLFGELSYNKEGSPWVHRYSERFTKWMGWRDGGTFDPGPLAHTLANGHVRVPEAFYEAVLPKVTLIKAVNQCLMYRNGYEVGRVKDIDGSKARHMKACEEVEREGTIYEYSLNGLVKGWHQVGF